MCSRKIVPIVEGSGEVDAVPLLLRRLLFEVKHRYEFAIAKPKNAQNRGALIAHLERFLEYARQEVGCAGVLVLLDADEDCASQLAIGLASRASTLYLSFPVAIVCAKCEYEAWFLASLETIAGKPLKGRDGLNADAQYDHKKVENLRDVKGWLSANMPPGRAYKETQDQVAMTELLDFNLARERSRSFRRLEHALNEILKAVDEQLNTVTPVVSV